MDLKDCLTPASCLICDVIHVGLQAYSSAPKKLKNNFTMKVNSIGEHFKPKGITNYSYSYPFSAILRNFLILDLMETWRKSSLRSTPAHNKSFWNHFSILGCLLNLGTAKNKLTYCFCTQPTLEVLAETVGLQVIFC